MYEFWALLKREEFSGLIEEAKNTLLIISQIKTK